jgi:RNA polymerase sigma-70 factor, ECF subfamily
MGAFQSWFGMSDEQAMWRVQMHDDAHAFASLLERWEEPIRHLGIRMLGDEHKAEDVTQEAFARIYTRRKDYQHGAKFSTYLWRVAINLCLDELRRIKRRRELSVLPHPDENAGDEVWDKLASSDPSPDSATVSGEQGELVRRAVMELPEHYRSVVVLRHYQDLKFREIAEVLDIPEGTVKSRMSEALAILHKVLRKYINESLSSDSSIRPKQREALSL